jgi:hypothetical protein
MLKGIASPSSGAAVFSSLTVNGATVFGGHVTFTPDNTYDIGANGATRPRNLYVGGVGAFANQVSATNFIAGASNSFTWFTRSVITSPADGNLRLTNNAQSSFGLLQFGGTSASFPALKRNGTTLEVKLADDSAYAPIAIGNTVNVVSPTSPNRTVTISIGGTTYYLAAKTTND